MRAFKLAILGNLFAVAFTIGMAWLVTHPTTAHAWMLVIESRMVNNQIQSRECIEFTDPMGIKRQCCGPWMTQQ